MPKLLKVTPTVIPTKVNPLNLESKNQFKNILVVLPSSPSSKFEANRSRGFWVMKGQTHKQTSRQIEITTLYIKIYSVSLFTWIYKNYENFLKFYLNDNIVFCICSWGGVMHHPRLDLGGRRGGCGGVMHHPSLVLAFSPLNSI